MKRKHKEDVSSDDDSSSDAGIVVVVNSSDSDYDSDDYDFGYSLVKGSGEYKSIYDFSIVSNPEYLENGGKPKFFSIEGLTTQGKELYVCGMCFSQNTTADTKVVSRGAF